MQEWAHRTVVAVCCAIALLSLGNLPELWRGSARLIRPTDPGGIAAHHAGLTALSAKLGAVKTLGFITWGADPATTEALYYDAAYELAPRFVLLNQNPLPTFIVGSFAMPVDPRLVAQANSIQLVEDFGGGVALFRRP